MSGMNVMPNARDRLAPSRRLLGVQGMLWGQPGLITARAPEKPSRAYVYLDVSGSMSAVLPQLLGLILPYVVRRQAVVFQFSTRVEPLPLAQLKGGKLRTTTGTDINCVLAHALAAVPPLKRVLILTDGYTGTPRADLLHAVQERKLRVYVVLPAESAHREQLEGLARSITVLPPLRPLRAVRR
jgi:uncharacterized protein with von Willebrand factor type A (vWA) domain